MKNVKFSQIARRDKCRVLLEQAHICGSAKSVAAAY